MKLYPFNNSPFPSPNHWQPPFYFLSQEYCLIFEIGSDYSITPVRRDFFLVCNSISVLNFTRALVLPHSGIFIYLVLFFYCSVPQIPSLLSIPLFALGSCLLSMLLCSLASTGSLSRRLGEGKVDEVLAWENPCSATVGWPCVSTTAPVGQPGTHCLFCSLLGTEVSGKSFLLLLSLEVLHHMF